MQFRAFAKALNDWIQLHPAFNVPSDDAHRLTGARAGWNAVRNSWSKFLVPYIGQDAFDVRLQLAIEPGLFKILGTLELSKIAEERPEAGIKRQRHKHGRASILGRSTHRRCVCH